MAVLPKLEGRHTLAGASAHLVGVYPGPVTDTVGIAAGEYWLTDPAGSLATFVANLNASGPFSGAGFTFTGSVDDDGPSATGKVSLAVSGGGATSMAILFGTGFNDIVHRIMLGWQVGLTPPANPLVSDGHASHFWLPNAGRVASTPDPTSLVYEMGTPEIDFTYREAPSGVSKRMAFTLRYKDSFLFHNIRGNKMWRTLESLANESFEAFWISCPSIGHPFRYFPDRANDALYFPWVNTDAGTINHEIVYESLVGQKGLWNISMNVAKHVP